MENTIFTTENGTSSTSSTSAIQNNEAASSAAAASETIQSKQVVHDISPQKRKLSADDTSSPSSSPNADAIKMFVGQIPKTWNEADARKFFENYGELHQVYILRDKSCHSSKGCCFVTYCTRDAALQAQQALHDVYRLPGMKHAIQMKPADVESKTERKLFVGMIPKSYDEQAVERLFNSYGVIEETSILRDDAGKSRGCAFVTFQSKSSVHQSIRSLHLQTTLPGCSAPIVVKLADSHRDRDRRRAVQSLLTSLGIDCRNGSGNNLLKLFCSNTQPFATLELNAIRQLLQSSENAVCQYTHDKSESRRNDSPAFSSRNSSAISAQQVSDLAKRVLYGSPSPAAHDTAPITNFPTTVSSFNSIMPETGANNAAVAALLAKILSGSSDQQPNTNAGGSNNSTSSLLNGLLSSLTKSLTAAAGSDVNPSATSAALYRASFAGDSQQQDFYSSASSQLLTYPNGYTSANTFAAYNNNSTETNFGLGHQQTAGVYGHAAAQPTAYTYNDGQQQSKRQRSSYSAAPGSSGYNYRY